MRLSCVAIPKLRLLFRRNCDRMSRRACMSLNWGSSPWLHRHGVRHLRSASALSNTVPQLDFDLTAVAFATTIVAACGYVAQTTLAEDTMEPVDRIISPTEIGQHNTESSCWITINNGVYDVTDFLQYHPGGKGS
eukprot:m.43292 g.43292  ORF g.43292 m.43292 type:complete len:135 (-) comp19340_c0_seq2:263-667(-)